MILHTIAALGTASFAASAIYIGSATYLSWKAHDADAVLIGAFMTTLFVGVAVCWALL